MRLRFPFGPDVEGRVEARCGNRLHRLSGRPALIVFGGPYSPRDAAVLGVAIVEATDEERAELNHGGYRLPNARPRVVPGGKGG